MSEPTPVGLLGTLIERLKRYAATVEFHLTTWTDDTPDQLGGWFPKMVEDVKGEWIRADELEAALATLPPAPPQGQEPRMIEVLGKALDTDERQMADLVRQLNHWKKKATELDAKLAASPPAQAQEPESTALELFSELELALYGKSGNTWEVNRSERVMRVLRKALAAAPPAQGWRDIATAPKDVTVLLWWPHWHRYPCIGRFVRNRWESEIAVSDDGPAPTHWLPLPAPPLAAQEQP
jgi:hypothetical protein